MASREELDNPHVLPEGIPVPVDDGLCDHLAGTALPPLALPSTSGREVALPELRRAVLFFYPRTGVPGEPAEDDWNWIPGARGCTPQSCGFRDCHDEFTRLGVEVFGVSTQTTAFQRAFLERNRARYEILSDEQLRLVRALNLPTFQYRVESGGPDTLIRRQAWYVEDGRIAKVWYPVFPPDRNAATVLAWLRERR
ncbi:MAG TPA: peroxiredoxin [Planctomycetota bacterium]|nr:peroxiredoxin [Planctomycetota bacterium]